MRAAYVLLEYPVLTQTFVTDEIAALEEAGADVTTVSVRGGPGADIALGLRPTRSPWVLARASRFATRHPIATWRALRLGPLSFGMRLKLVAAAGALRGEGITAVHAHFAYANADAAEVLGHALGTGHSLTVHAHDIFVEHEHLARRLSAARLVITVCEYNARHLRAKYPLVGDRLHVVPCSTRIADRPPRTIVFHQPPRLLAVGRLIPKKGHDVVIRAMAAMHADAHLKIIGDGPDRAALEHLALELGVAGRVEFCGAQSHAQTTSAFAEADVFTMAFRVAPDGDRDSMPVVVKEAMAAGLPVVTTREVGVPEMVTDGVTGLLVEPDDVDGLAAALDAVIGDPAVAAAMGERGREAVAARFDLRQQAKALLEVLG